MQETDGLFAAVDSGDVTSVLSILSAEFSNRVDVRDTDGRTPLHRASSLGHHALVTSLLSLGADPETTDDSGWTPLLSSSSAGHPLVVRTLLRSPKLTDPNRANARGCTALHYACSKLRESCVEELLAATSVRTTLKDSAGATPLHRVASALPTTMAEQTTSTSIARRVLERTPVAGREALVNARDAEGKTALHVAVQMRNKRLVQALATEFGADPCVADSEGHTAPWYATVEFADEIHPLFSQGPPRR